MVEQTTLLRFKFSTDVKVVRIDQLENTILRSYSKSPYSTIVNNTPLPLAFLRQFQSKNLIF